MIDLCHESQRALILAVEQGSRRVFTTEAQRTQRRTERARRREILRLTGAMAVGLAVPRACGVDSENGSRIHVRARGGDGAHLRDPRGSVGRGADSAPSGAHQRASLYRRLRTGRRLAGVCLGASERLGFLPDRSAQHSCF